MPRGICKTLDALDLRSLAAGFGNVPIQACSCNCPLAANMASCTVLLSQAAAESNMCHDKLPATTVRRRGFVATHVKNACKRSKSCYGILVAGLRNWLRQANQALEKPSATHFRNLPGPESMQMMQAALPTTVRSFEQTVKTRTLSTC